MKNLLWSEHDPQSETTWLGTEFVSVQAKHLHIRLIKGIVHAKLKSCHHLHTFMPFQLCKSFSRLIFEALLFLGGPKQHWTPLKFIAQTKKSPTGLEQHEAEQIMKELSFLGKQFLYVHNIRKLYNIGHTVSKHRKHKLNFGHIVKKKKNCTVRCKFLYFNHKK